MKVSTTWLLAAGCLLGPVISRPAAHAQVAASRAAVPVAQALQRVKALYGTDFVFEERLLAGKTTTVQVLPGRSVEELLKAILYPHGLLFLYVDKTHYTIVEKDRASTAVPVVSGGEASLQAQGRTISGVVRDEKGVPLPGVTLLVGTSGRVGAATNADGRFALGIPGSAQAINVSCIGYESQVVPLTASNVYLLTLRAQTTGLDEVQVISNGYTELPRERATGAFGVVTAKQLEEIPVPNLLQRLEGQVAGVQLNITSSDNSFVYSNVSNSVSANNVGANAYSLTLRGASTLTGNNKPLIVIDGLPTEFDLRTLNPDDVEQLTFLKDAAAASIWGVRAANGVIVIQTKKGRFNRAPTVSFSTSFTQAGRPRLGYLPLLNASQEINYERELVDRGILTDPGLAPATPSTSYLPRPVTEAQEWLFRAQRGTATVAQRDSALAALGSRGTVGYDQLQQYLLRPAQAQVYDVSISGGGENNTYFVSGSYSKERTNAVNGEGSRFTLTANQQFKLFKVATLTANARGTFFNQGQGALGLGPLSPGYFTGINLLPYNQLADASGNGVNYAYAYYQPKLDQLKSLGYQDWTYNYLTELGLVNGSVRENNFWGSVGLAVPLSKGLSASGLYSMERTYGEIPVYYAPTSYYARNLENSATSYSTATGRLTYGIPLGGILNQGAYGNNNYTLRGQLTFDHDYSQGKHQVNAVGGAEMRQVVRSAGSQLFFGYNDQSQTYAQVNYVAPYTTVAGGSTTINNTANYLDREYRFLSYFGNASYTLLDRYTASGSVRYDDYNNFGLDRKYRATPLYSAGLAWTLKKEAWLRDYAWLSTLRLRATYGLNGNIPAEATPYTALTLGTNDNPTLQPYASISAPANPTLRWEKTAVTNLGLDFGFFDSRLSGTLEVYYKRSTDLFVLYPTNSTYGFTSLSRNAAKLNGNGVDLTLAGSPVRTTSWGWDLSGTVGYNTNRVVDYQLDNSATVALNPGSLSVLNNYPLNYLFVYRSAGLDNQGRTQVYDHNEGLVNSNTTIRDLSDLVYAGRTTPAYYGGLTQTVRYKQLALFVQTLFKFDYVFLPPTFSPLPSAGVFRGYDLNADIDRRWRQPGDEATTAVPGIVGGSGNSYTRYVYSDSRVQRGDHIRLREVSLRYTLPAKLLGSAVPFVKAVSVSAAARNLGILWRRNTLGIDPDFQPNTSTLSLPPAVSYVLSLNASF